MHKNDKWQMTHFVISTSREKIVKFFFQVSIETKPENKASLDV